MDQEEVFQFLLQSLKDPNNDNDHNFLNSQENNQMNSPESVISTEAIIKLFTMDVSEAPKYETSEELSPQDFLQVISNNTETAVNQEQLNQALLFSMLSESMKTFAPTMDNNSSLKISGNNHINMEDTTNEWIEEYNKLNPENNFKFEKDDVRSRQMAKNREYAKKCVQKKKDVRKQAEIKCTNVLKKIEIQQKLSQIKEKNANFAVELREMIDDMGGEEQRKVYMNAKEALLKDFVVSFSMDEAVNFAFYKLSSAREEFEKATTDLREKNGVVGTLGSRKIRAKQQMEWRHHLYNLSIYEHNLRRETKLSKLVDDYVRKTVPQAVPLVESIPKNLLDKLIKSNRTAELEEFVQFVGDNKWIFDTDNNNFGAK